MHATTTNHSLFVPGGFVRWSTQSQFPPSSDPDWLILFPFPISHALCLSFSDLLFFSFFFFFFILFISIFTLFFFITAAANLTSARTSIFSSRYQLHSFS